jgi:hypothetical protein
MSDPTLADAAFYKAQNPQLSLGDIRTYNISKTNYFKGTIAVCAIYGAVALLMLMLVLFSEKGSQFMSETFRAFTITFVVGLVLVVIILVVQIMSFKPSVLTQSPYDTSMCPDNWTLQETPDTSFDALSDDPTDIALMQYKCVAPSGFATKAQTSYSVPASFDATEASIDVLARKKLVHEYNPTLSERTKTTGSNITYNCSTVYPQYLAAKNLLDTDINNSPNLLACAFATQCGVPWTSMCPTGAVL